jgi:putative NADH-flavin reductase
MDLRSLNVRVGLRNVDDVKTTNENLITIMGATGNTGSKIAEALLAKGRRVRALGRSEDRLSKLKSAGAEVRTGDAADAAFLTEAFRGAQAVYTLLPTDRSAPDYRAAQDQQGEAIVKAIRDSGVKYVVALSSVGAELSNGTGVIAGLHAQEERLKAIAKINVLLLRRCRSSRTFTTHSKRSGMRGSMRTRNSKPGDSHGGNGGHRAGSDRSPRTLRLDGRRHA